MLHRDCDVPFVIVGHVVLVHLGCVEVVVQPLPADLGLDHRDYKLWQLVQRLAHDVEVAERHKGNLSIEDVGRIDEHKSGKGGDGNKEGGGVEEESLHRLEVGELLQVVNLRPPDLLHLKLEARLPSVKLQHLHAVQDLIHRLHPCVLELHVLPLVSSHLGAHQGVGRDEKDHHQKASKARGAQETPERVDGQEYGDRAGPEEVQTLDNVHKSLGVNLHEVDCFPH